MPPKRASAGIPEIDSANRFHRWLSALPQGSFKIFIGSIIAVGTTLAVISAPYFEAMFCAIRYRWVPQVPANVVCSHLEIPDGALWALVGIIAGFIGGSSWDFSTKRHTYQPSPPMSLDTEDVKAGATITTEQPVVVPVDDMGKPLDLGNAPFPIADRALPDERATSVPPELRDATRTPVDEIP